MFDVFLFVCSRSVTVHLVLSINIRILVGNKQQFHIHTLHTRDYARLVLKVCKLTLILVINTHILEYQFNLFQGTFSLSLFDSCGTV